jgi:hypothetical protein
VLDASIVSLRNKASLERAAESPRSGLRQFVKPFGCNEFGWPKAIGGSRRWLFNAASADVGRQ